MILASRVIGILLDAPDGAIKLIGHGHGTNHVFSVCMELGGGKNPAGG
jgi:hypothetical protein